MKKPKPITATSPGLPAPGGTVAASLRLGRFVGLFVVTILLGFGLLTAPFARPAFTGFSGILVRISGVLIDVCGGHVIVEGAVLRSQANGFAVEMANGCNGVHVMILLWASVIAFPATLRQKGIGLLAGTAAIQGVNFVRFISLFYLGQYSRAWFDFAHFYLWEALIVLDALVFFWLWVQFVFRAEAPGDAGR